MTTITQSNTNPATQLILGGASALIVAASFTNLPASLGLSDRALLIGLTAAGFAMCSAGKLGQGARYGWTNPRHMAGYVIGALALAASAAGIFNFPLLWVTGERAALLTLAGLMLVKFLIARTYPKLP